MREAEYAPRRRLWPVFVPLLLVVGVAIIWTGLWFLGVGVAERTIDGWREREARGGRVYACDEQTTSGFPFRIEVRCVKPAIELSRTNPPVALKATDLVVVSQVYQPTLLITELKGPMSVASPGQPPSYVANWTVGQASLRGTPKAPERISIVFDRPSVDRVGGEAPTLAMKADRIELHGRIAEGAVNDNPVIETVLRLTSAIAPELHSFTTQPIDADITAKLYGLANFAPKPWPVRFREIQSHGGRIEISKARVQQGESIAVSAGTLGLTERGGLDGEIEVTIVGLEAIVKSLGVDIDRVMSRGKIGSAITALDRIVPGLGQIARQNAAPAAIVGLRAMGKQTTLEGKPATTLPLRFNDGQILLGPIPVGRVPPLF
jgi:hypothetical protein